MQRVWRWQRRTIQMSVPSPSLSVWFLCWSACYSSPSHSAPESLSSGLYGQLPALSIKQQITEFLFPSILTIVRCFFPHLFLFRSVVLQTRWAMGFFYGFFVQLGVRLLCGPMPAVPGHLEPMWVTGCRPKIHDKRDQGKQAAQPSLTHEYQCGATCWPRREKKKGRENDPPCVSYQIQKAATILKCIQIS